MFSGLISPHLAEAELSKATSSAFCVGFPGGSDGKESAYNAGDSGLISGLRRSPAEGNGYPLQYSCLENSMDRGAWWATVRGIAKIWKQLSG